MNPLIICEDIWKVYRVGDVDVLALRGLRLTIEQGEFVAIMGSSGSGKSTLMNILGCLDPPTRGQYRLNGVEVGCLRPDQLAEIRNQQIGFVLQSFNLVIGSPSCAAARASAKPMAAKSPSPWWVRTMHPGRHRLIPTATAGARPGEARDAGE